MVARTGRRAYDARMTRKVVLSAGISLDGYVARLDGAVDYLFMPKDYSMGPFFATVDAAVMGRKTYEAGLKMGGEAMLKSGGMEYYVFSKTLAPGARNYVTFVNEPIPEFVEKLRAKPGKNIWHMGGGELTRAFLQADSIDELYLGIVPKLIGEGLPMFPPSYPERHFALKESKTYEGGLLTLTYERVRSGGTAPAKAPTKPKRKR
jgi:dihydrofolate reductase